MKTNKIITILLSIIILIFQSIITLKFDIPGENNYLNGNSSNISLKKSDSWVLTSITIDGSGGWTWALTQPWCYGSGTMINPYIIENVIINGDDHGHCLSVENSNVFFIIRNCTFYSSATGIHFNNVEKGSIINCTLFDNHDEGILLFNSFQCKILNNCLYNIGHYSLPTPIPEYSTVGGALALWNSDDNLIQGNIFNSNEGYGVALGYTTTTNAMGRARYPCINNNVSKNFFNRTGKAVWTLPSSKENIISDNKIIDSSIFLEGSLYTTLSDNNLSNAIIWFRGSKESVTSYYIDNSNQLNEKPVYYYANVNNLGKDNITDAGLVILANCKNSLIRNTSLDGCFDIQLYYCTNNSFNQNFLNCGISLDFTNNSVINENRFTKNFYLSLYYSHDNSFLNCSINSSSPQVWLSNSNNNIISDNNITTKEACYNTINLFGANNNEISSNKLELANNNPRTFNTIGIEIDRGENNSILENHINNPDIGILVGSRFTKISYNTIINTEIGISLCCSYSTITYNTINNCDIGLLFENSYFNYISKNVIIAKNACYQIDSDSQDNTFKDNHCNLSGNQIGGYFPILILLWIIPISIITYSYKKNAK